MPIIDSPKHDADLQAVELPETKLYGADLIAAYVKTLTNAPGVYRMFDADGVLLYVGKAKSLKKRVIAYTKYDRHPVRIKRMIRATTNMEFVITDSETEALLLEASLIKRLKPRYNILLRDDKSFPYILMRKDHEAAQLMKHRGKRSKKGDYYGPFASAQAVNRTLDTLQRAFRLRTCSDSVYEGRTRPCMLYQIKRCSAPCTGEISIKDYAQLNDDASDFLSGKSEDLRTKMQAQMSEASHALAFEKAGVIRDRLQAMAFVSSGQTHVTPSTFMEADIAAIHMDAGQACVQVFFFRAGQNWGSNAYFPRHSKDQEAPDILDAFLAQFYLGKPIPKQVFVNQDLPNKDLLEAALSERKNDGISRPSHFKIFRPQRGEKADIVELARKNASEALARKMAETASQTKLLRAIAEAFDLKTPPERIEVYDNSHIQGTNAVGAFIVAGVEGFLKREYRTFNIKDLGTEPGDDYAMMREVMRRRFSKLLKEDELVWPDLVLIDGGKGQLSVVTDTLRELGVLERTTLVAIAKGPDRNAGRESFHMNGRPEFILPQRTPVLYYLQRLRDEAHRFAIGTHRARRKKQMHQNPLDAINGIGAARKKALLAYFGSAKAVGQASVEDLTRIEGVSKTLAKVIHDYFNE
ncbi:MAG: excinuclease ABC subunit C [Robiginitomaculum sp.]|nr:MAG: excinuclease ABC subunit C [Robiginitomaculum sp.]